MDDKIIFHQNCAEDFLFIFQFSDGERPGYPWTLVFNTCLEGHRSVDSFTASFDGKVYKNCEPGDNTTDVVLVKFKDHHLPPGRLYFKLCRKVPNELFDDGNQKRVLPVPTDWELWKGPTDRGTPPVASVIAERVLKGTPGEAGQIESMTASVDGTTGRPSVEVKLGGTPEKRTIALEFSGLKGETPKIAADEEGNIYSDEELVTDVVAKAVTKAATSAETADEQADRAKALADHPPKIVDVEGLKYWAFWDETAKDYVTSEYRAEGGAIMPLFWVDPETLMLYVTYQNGYEGAKFKLENGILYAITTVEQ